MKHAIIQKIRSREPAAVPCFIIDQSGDLVRNVEQKEALEKLQRDRPEYFKHSNNTIH
ncbi:hypothetical protein CLV24_104165 [Pontibacter ummariensis]|uniref:Uncharacterized protein n=1 Tax=Pontibacter ummariensis TaxID=1610492 RepID=A0A239DC78_9BACT|nr:hypothetical protein [Pontibacter ummariensis]PRY14355.1 hypothetical protein CLV24_104165 [Pontibacter ummariensis]SNS29985.1 hypothetical protein SAMN06296052_104164 [Pontibacter ummariensis]